MQVWTQGRFVDVQVLGREDAWNGSVFNVHLGDRMEQVPVGQDAVQQATYHGHERDLHALVGHKAAQVVVNPVARPAPVSLGELQTLWNQAALGVPEKTASRILYLLLLARHRGVVLDVFALAASLQRSVWEVLTALALLHGYGAIVLGQGEAPNPADTSLHAATAYVRLGSDPPDVARLHAFAEALARVPDGVKHV